jgi:phage shock protein A
MTVFSRVVDILRAKTHKILNSLEDPNESLDLSYEKMIAGLQETKVHLADVVAQQKSLERQIEAARQEAANAENDARIALRSDREDLAKAALAHKHSALEKLASVEAAHAGLLPQVQKLIETEKKLEDRIEKFRLQKEVMKISYTAAAAEVQATQAMTGVGSGVANVGETLRRAEDKVSGMRAKADVMQSLTEAGVLVDTLDNRSKEAREIDALLVGSAIASDLAKLKSELAAGKDGPPAA